MHKPWKGDLEGVPTWAKTNHVSKVLGADPPSGGYVGVNPKIGGKPPKWMVYKGKPYIKWMILGGFPTVFGSPPM